MKIITKKDQRKNAQNSDNYLYHNNISLVLLKNIEIKVLNVMLT